MFPLIPSWSSLFSSLLQVFLLLLCLLLNSSWFCTHIFFFLHSLFSLMIVLPCTSPFQISSNLLQNLFYVHCIALSKDYRLGFFKKIHLLVNSRFNFFVKRNQEKHLLIFCLKIFNFKCPFFPFFFCLLCPKTQQKHLSRHRHMYRLTHTNIHMQNWRRFQWRYNHAQKVRCASNSYKSLLAVKPLIYLRKAGRTAWKQE